MMLTDRRARRLRERRLLQLLAVIGSLAIGLRTAVWYERMVLTRLLEGLGTALQQSREAAPTGSRVP